MNLKNECIFSIIIYNKQTKYVGYSNSCICIRFINFNFKQFNIISTLNLFLLTVHNLKSNNAKKEV